MTKKEAIQAALEGKRVKHKDQYKGYYWVYNPAGPGLFLDYNGDIARLPWDDGYEIVKQTVKHSDVLWVNIHSDQIYPTLYPSKEMANKCSYTKDRITCVPVTIEWETEE